MTPAILLGATFCIVTTAIHLASVLIAIARFRAGQRRKSLPRQFPAISLVRPLCGMDNYAADTLRSTFELDYPRYEILFCVASANDPVVPLVEALIAGHAGANFVGIIAYAGMTTGFFAPGAVGFFATRGGGPV